ncbi:hypothetical protein ACTHT4_11380, partial [Neisseria sp. P0022.S007]|uniref:hypothetical protein n=1 Tax=Neisseria sp. P0022.S007 TaxID=3436832 RepID=UPI003F7DFA7F
HLKPKQTTEHHNTTSYNIINENNDLIQNRQTDTAKEFIHQDKTAPDQARIHEAEQNSEWLGNKVV